MFKDMKNNFLIKSWYKVTSSQKYKDPKTLQGGKMSTLKIYKIFYKNN